ncbi:MAG: hypothetical protein FWC89_02050 [Defluviitaleaceae bacterium]|nr:hypothetical protein [Defluviitaleaceae bacterium]
MGGARIFVLHKKDLVRIGAIVIAGLVILIMALVLLLPRGGREYQQPAALARFVPGTYASTIILNDEPIHVRVTVSENEILSIYMTDMGEVQRTFYPLFEPRMRDLAEEILRYQTAHIDPSTDYPVTTGILQEAVRTALELAYAEMMVAP